MLRQHSIGPVMSEVSHLCWLYTEQRCWTRFVPEHRIFLCKPGTATPRQIVIWICFWVLSVFPPILVKLDHRLGDSNWLSGWQVLMWNCALIFECVVGHCVYFLQKFLETLSTSRLYILIYKTLYIQAGPFYSVFASHYRPWMFTSWQHCNISGGT